MKKLSEYFDLRDAHVYLGLALVCTGICLIYVPAALIASGGILIWLGTRRS
jgi:hypothetical protein